MTPDEEKLIQERDLTQHWGEITDFQRLQLKYWSLLAVPGAQTVAFVPDPEAWTLTFVARVPAKHQADECLLEGFARSVAWLLGGGWDLVVRAEQKNGWCWRQPGNITARDRSRFDVVRAGQHLKEQQRLGTVS